MFNKAWRKRSSVAIFLMWKKVETRRWLSQLNYYLPVFRVLQTCARVAVVIKRGTHSYYQESKRNGKRFFHHTNVVMVNCKRFKIVLHVNQIKWQIWWKVTLCVPQWKSSTSTTKWPQSFGWLSCHFGALAYSTSPKVTNEVSAIQFFLF